MTDWFSHGVGHYELEKTGEFCGLVFYKNGGAWTIPPGLLELLTTADADDYLLPFSDLVDKVPNIPKRPRRTKEEMEGVEKTPRNENIKTKNKKIKNKRIEPTEEIKEAKKKIKIKIEQRSHSIRIAFYFEKGFTNEDGDSLEGQSSLAVSCAFKILIETKFFEVNGVSNSIRIWSDGGPHHYKTLEHLYFVSWLISHFKVVERYFFDAYYGWSICDQWFGGLKRDIGEVSSNNRGPDSVDDIGKIIARNNALAIKLDPSYYNETRDLFPESGNYQSSDSFIKKNNIFIVTGLGSFKVTDDTINQKWSNHTINITGNEKKTEKDEKYDNEFLGKSKTYINQITPTDKKRQPVKKTRFSDLDKLSFDSEFDDSSDESYSENSENSDNYSDND